MDGARAGDHVLFHHHAAHVVGAETQSNLANVRPHGDPARADRMNVVEVQAAECLGAQVFRCTGHPNAATEFRMRFLGAASIKLGNDVAREGL